MILENQGFTANCQVISGRDGAYLLIRGRDPANKPFSARSRPMDPIVSGNDRPEDHIEWFCQQINLRAAEQCATLARLA